MALSFLLDEDAMSDALTGALRQAGIRVTTVGEVRRRGKADEDHLTWAREQGFVIVTHNIADFARLHAAWLAAGRSHAGIAASRQGQFQTGEHARRLQRLSAAMDRRDMAGRFEYLSSWG